MESVGFKLSLSRAPRTVASSDGTTTKNVGSELNSSNLERDSHLSLDLKLSNEGSVRGTKDNQADGNKQISHDPRRVFLCKFCEAKFTKSRALAAHQRAHKREIGQAQRSQGLISFGPLNHSRFHPYSNRSYYGYTDASLQEASRMLMPSTALPFSSIHRLRISDTFGHINGFEQHKVNSILNFGASPSSDLAGKTDYLMRNPWTASSSNASAYSSIYRPRNESFNAFSHIDGFGATTVDSFRNIGACSPGGLIQSFTGAHADREISDEVDPSGIDLSLKL